MTQREKGENIENMNYYNPNFYQNYPYGNNQYASPYQPQNQNASQFNQMAAAQNQVLGLNGKLVDTIDMVKVTEVPIGGYGIFPKADLTEIYIKSWNPNGTTSILTFKPVLPEPPKAEPQDSPIVNEILQKLNSLEQKLDTWSIPIVQPQPQNTIKKEINANDY